MTNILNITIQEFINSSDGIFYVLNEKLEILFITEKPWNDFAIANEIEVDPISKILGTNVLNQFAGEETKENWDNIFKFSITKQKPISISYECPSPDVDRKGVILITPIKDKEIDYNVFLIVQSIIFHVNEHPKMELYSNQVEINKNLPFILMCSFCKRIKLDSQWNTAEVYYQKGGSSQINISHGICPTCRKIINDKISTM